MEYGLKNFEYKMNLYPVIPHPTQVLVYSMLLYCQAVYQRDEEVYGCICNTCMLNLLSNKQPPLSLSNNMWIGDIPDELSILSLPERILISIYYPAAYIIKLYLKRKGAQHWDTSVLNNGLRGNVSTYRLNTCDIASMVEGKFLPPSPSILAATIRVTIIGPKNLPECCMPSMLSVNQHRVRCALQFLKQENLLYEDVTISDENLSRLLENDIPVEIVANVKHSEETTKLEEEREGYV